MMIPGPDHPITTARNPARVRARINGHVIADTDDALALQEASYPVVQYLPKADVETGFLSRSDKVTHCPYKGDATHWSMMIDGDLIENAAWSYEDPHPHMEAIKGRIAFYPDKVEVYAVDEEALKHHQHTETPPTDRL